MASALLLLSLLFAGAQAPRTHRHHRRQLAETWSSVFAAPNSEASGRRVHPEASGRWGPEPCADCAARKAPLESSGRDSDLESLRIEIIKQQILEKLRLQEPPSVAKGVLPEPLSTVGPALRPAGTLPRPAEDFYGKTEQVIIFPETGDGRCVPRPLLSAACITFRFPADLGHDDIISAQLWLYKRRGRHLDDRNQTFTVSAVAHWKANRSVPKSELIASHITSVDEGWVKINLLWAVKHWLEYSELPHTIQVACKTCGTDASTSPISLLPENRPFLIINTNSDSSYQRPKRNVDCVPGLSECCRESLYVSFAAIGWDEWILQPPGYHAYYCRGSCSSTASLTTSASHYTTVMQRLLNHQGSSKKPELAPCCTATHLSPIELIYMDNKQTVTQKILPNMAVDTCGCM